MTPFTYRTVGARYGDGAPNDADYEITLLKRAAKSRIHDSAEGFVPNHWTPFAWRRPAVLAFRDLDAGPANADGDGFHEDGPVRLGYVFQTFALGVERFYRDGFHFEFFSGRTPLLLTSAFQRICDNQGNP